MKPFKNSMLLGLLLTITPTAFANYHSNKSLAFFVGHSQWDKGSQGINGLPPEWDYCSGVAKQVSRLSKRFSINVKVFYRPREDYHKALNAMYKLKNEWNLKAPVISCHYNATPDSLSNVQLKAPQLKALFNQDKKPVKGSLIGTLVLYKPDPKSKILATKLFNNVEKIFPRNTKKYTNVSGIIPLSKQDRGNAIAFGPNIKSPAVLLEIGYGDSKWDSKIMMQPNFKKRLAKAILTAAASNL